jgi:hypothetical protein
LAHIVCRAPNVNLGEGELSKARDPWKVELEPTDHLEAESPPQGPWS